LNRHEFDLQEIKKSRAFEEGKDKAFSKSEEKKGM
jgi:hypothetical protein